MSRDIRRLLDAYGFKKTQRFLDEWNSGILPGEPEQLSAAGHAAFKASALIYMQDSPIDAQTLYVGLNLFGEDEKTPNKVGQSLVALGRMKATPVRLAVSGADRLGLAVQAGRSAAGKEIDILVSNYEVPVSMRGARDGPDKLAGAITLLPRRDFDYRNNRGIDLKVNCLIPDQLYRVERYRISDVWDYRLLYTVTLKGRDVAISDMLPAPAVELIVVKPSPAPH